MLDLRQRINGCLDPVLVLLCQVFREWMQDRADLVIERPQKAAALGISKSKASSILANTAQPLSNAFPCTQLQTLFRKAALVHQRHELDTGACLKCSLLLQKSLPLALLSRPAGRHPHASFCK